MKIKFDSDVNFSLNNPIVTIVVRAVFHEKQILSISFLDECLYKI